MKYKIILNEYMNEYGKVTNSHFIIEIEKSFLGFKYWSTVKHKVSNISGVYNVTTEFKTIEDAQRYITMLDNEDMRQGWNETVVEQSTINR
jgi:hypothetical protein